MNNIDVLDIRKVGPKFEECEELFPERVNTEFVKVMVPDIDGDSGVCLYNK
jgi:diaminopimelate epimerase